MFNLLLSLIVYFDSECKIPAVKMEDRDKVNWLDDNKNNNVKYTCEDYLFIERWYKLKLKGLE